MKSSRYLLHSPEIADIIVWWDGLLEVLQGPVEGLYPASKGNQILQYAK